MESRRCTAKSKRSGGRCKRPAKPGTNVCAMHGAKAPQVAKAAKRRVDEDRVAGQVGAILAHLDREGQHPLDGLLEDVRRTGTMARLLEHLVADLDLKPGGSGEMLYGPNGQHVVVDMLRQWTRDHAKACKLALDAKIDQRRVDLASGQAQAVAGVLRGMSDALLTLVIDLAGDRRQEIERVWREQWPSIARKQLEAIDLKAS